MVSAFWGRGIYQLILNRFSKKKYGIHLHMSYKMLKLQKRKGYNYLIENISNYGTIHRTK